MDMEPVMAVTEDMVVAMGLVMEQDMTALTPEGMVPELTEHPPPVQH